MNEIKMNKYRVAYRDENRKLRYKVIAAKTDTGALICFKRQTGIKGITAKYMLTKDEETKIRTIGPAAVNGRATYFDGRTLCYCDNDAIVGAEYGYTH